MRVLWLCNIMLPMIAQKLNIEASNKEGWLSGLASAVLERQGENQIELAVAFPQPVGCECGEKHVYDGSVIYKGALPASEGGLRWYTFEEDVVNPHLYDEKLELQMHYITQDFQPDVVHCFGTEYPHTLAICRAFPRKERILVGIQGLCSVYADAYFADLPSRVVRSKTLRDWLKKDDLLRQQNKFVLRGEMEKEAITLTGNVTGRTAWDKYYTGLWNPSAVYFAMNETLRSNFYGFEWTKEACEPHSIFLSQGDYPIKGLHYMLLALPEIRKVYPDVKVYVAGNSITGDGGLMKRLKISAYGRYLRRLIQKEKLEEHICFLGRLDAEEMKKRYLQSHLFVCCSSIENSPNSLGEAMLLGVPCVSADVGGISSIFTHNQDGIIYEGFQMSNPGINNTCDFDKSRDGLLENARNLAKSVLEIWSNPEKMQEYSQNAREHAKRTHNREANYTRMTEIYAEIAKREASADAGMSKKVVFVSNYINHHQIPFCEEMYRYLGGDFVFIQTEPMEQERISMGWQSEIDLPYVKYYYEEPEICRALINRCPVVFFGGVDDESYIKPRLDSGKPVIRYSERIYKEGQWKAVSPRGLIKKYQDHTKYRKAPVYMFCAGAYVPSDFQIVKAYPGKMRKWGYFPKTKHYDVDKLMANKRPATILWAARFLDWKHPEVVLQCANYLKSKGISFELRIVGDGDQRPLVEKLLKEYDLSDRVTLLGYRTPEQVRALMEESDIYLTTSDRKEGWGAVINEAMNSGCAVVANHMMGAAPYLIRHGENGLVYQDGKPRMLYETVEKLLKERSLCQKLGREAVKTIEEEWNAQIAAKRLLQFCVSQKFLDKVQISEEVTLDMQEGSIPKSGPCSVAEVISERKMMRKIMREAK